MMLNDILEGNTLEAAKSLLGCKLIHKQKEKILEAVITETEAYMGPSDKASHSYNNKRTKRTDVMYRKPGTIYIYTIYGLYQCLNIVTEPIDYPAAVLIRGAIPLPSSLDAVSFNRFKCSYEELSPYQRNNLLNGPGKLMMGLEISKNYNGLMINESPLIIESYMKIPKNAIEMLPRIGIDYADEYKHKLWRFKLKDEYVVDRIADLHGN